ncbi:hypothetical protein YA0599_03300 [Pseudomonas syringae]|jgi:hypothetical protein|nr:hypothetical protein [Pseudomonas syringae]NMZ02572.1 hypothetical protein [Pseudomonas proteolytica]
MSISQYVTVEATKLSPPVAVITASLSGMSVDDWVKALTLLYLVCQITFSVLKNRREAKESEAKSKASQ